MWSMLALTSGAHAPVLTPEKLGRVPTWVVGAHARRQLAPGPVAAVPSPAQHNAVPGLAVTQAGLLIQLVGRLAGATQREVDGAVAVVTSAATRHAGATPLQPAA